HKLADVTAEIAGFETARGIGHPPANRDGHPDDFREVNRLIFAQQLRLNHKGATELLGDRATLEQELVGLERRDNLDGTLFLDIRHNEAPSVTASTVFQSNAKVKSFSVAPTCTRRTSVPLAKRFRNSRPI